MKPGYNSCPNCGHKLTWRDRVRLAPTVFRKVVPCPMCGAKLSWPKRPYRLMMTGTALLLLLAAPSKIDGGRWAFLLILPLALIAVGVLGLKVELHKPVASEDDR